MVKGTKSLYVLARNQTKYQHITELTLDSTGLDGLLHCLHDGHTGHRRLFVLVSSINMYFCLRLRVLD